MSALQEALTSDELLALRERNEQRAREARERLGTVYLCHPANRVQRKPLRSQPMFEQRPCVPAPEWLVDRCAAGAR